MNYWVDLFTGTTWREFQRAGAGISGYREHNWNRAATIKPGDMFLCYMVGVKRWVGVLEVTSERYRDSTKIWDEEVFPVRFAVTPSVMLEPENGVPMEAFRGKLSFFPQDCPPGKWSGRVRGSPTKYSKEDGEVIVAALQEAKKRPVSQPVDPKKLKRSANLYKLKKTVGNREIETVVAVPTEEFDEPIVKSLDDGPTHTEIQWKLLNLGSQMGLNVWAPKSDRNRNWNGSVICDVPRLLDALPTQFDEITTRTIENIDVLWLNKNAIVAAFEVEHSTSIYSGLLRMSDLLTMQPNIDIKLYLAAPDERYTKFKNEVPRPTFASRDKPLHTVCGFLPYSSLCDRLQAAESFLSHLKPEFIDDIAEFFDPADEYDA